MFSCGKPSVYKPATGAVDVATAGAASEARASCAGSVGQPAQLSVPCEAMTRPMRPTRYHAAVPLPEAQF